MLDFEDIYAGAFIEVRTKYLADDDFTQEIVKTGVAYGQATNGDWLTENGRTLVYKDRHFPTQIKELVERPKQLPTEPGTVFRATEIRGEKCDVKMFVREGLTYNRLYTSARLINGEPSFMAEDITEWEEI